MRRIVFAAVTVVAALIVSAGLSEAGVTPTGQFTVSPNPAFAGDDLTVTSVTTCQLPGEVNLAITDAEGHEVVGETVPTEEDGSWEFNITIPSFATPGEYTVSATCDLPDVNTVEALPPFQYEDVTLFINAAQQPEPPAPTDPGPAAQPAAVVAVTPAFTG